MPALTVTGSPGLAPLLERYELTGKPVAVAYLSFGAGDASFIGAHDPDGTIVPLIEFAPLPVRGADLLDAIAAIDENAPRLVARYESEFGEIAARVREFAADAEPGQDASARWLMSAASLLLWLSEQDVTRALEPSSQAVRADTMVIEDDGRFVLDTRRFLRSLMSYRLAGIPGHVLARSAFESLGDFTADALHRLLQDWKADAVVCAGDLFARNTILRDRARQGTLRLRLPVRFPAPGGP